ncbi:MAG: phosphatase PAP2 family protein [Bacilli bacterium]|nr:phosphatase PAP2 family protein [Bacilli bacterium]
MKRKLTISFLALLFCVLAFLLVREALLPSDLSISYWVKDVYGESLIWLYKPITDFGDIYILPVFVIFTVIYLHKKEPKKIMPFLILMAASLLLVLLFKFIFARQRPDIMGYFIFNGYSFPSGHSVMSSTFYLYIASLCMQKGQSKCKYIFALFSIVLAITIGFSRIYLGAHYFSDVMAGFILGALLLNIVLLWEEGRRA